MGKWVVSVIAIIILMSILPTAGASSYESVLTAKRGTQISLSMENVETEILRRNQFTLTLKMKIIDFGEKIYGIRNLTLSVRLYSNTKQYEVSFKDDFGSEIFFPPNIAISLPDLFVSAGAPSELGLYVKAEFSEMSIYSGDIYNNGNWILVDTIKVNTMLSPTATLWIVSIFILGISIFIWKKKPFRQKKFHSSTGTAKKEISSSSIPILEKITNSDASIARVTMNQPTPPTSPPYKISSPKLKKTFNCRSCGSSPNVGDSYCYECGTRLI